MRLATRLRGGATRVLTFEPACVRRASSASTGAPSAASGDELDAVYRTLLDVSDREQRIHITDAQQTAVHCATKGYSVFLHLPTGAGKSLAFQAPALAAPPGKTTLVVSPLIALMHDQVNALRRKGISAVQVSGEERKKGNSPPLAQLLANQRLVYTTPEFLLQNGEMQQWVRRVADQSRIARVVLDEAHCVLEWGNTFRPAYLELSQWRARFFSALPLTLATASVTDEEIAQLAAIFHLEIVSSAMLNAVSTQAEPYAQMVVVQQVTDRANLRLEVVRKPAASTSSISTTAAAAAAAAHIIATQVAQLPTIVYCLTRKEAEDVCLSLVRLGCHAGVYHGGLPRKRREFVRKQWMGGQLSIICATSAFGMGIDRADVRFVVHNSLPLSLSSYLQQIGRAGRDGKSAVCLLLFDEGDKSRANAITSERADTSFDSFSSSGFQSSNGGSSHVELEEVVAFCSTVDCRKEFLYAHFGFPYDGKKCPRNCNCGPLAEDAYDETEFLAELGLEDDSMAKRSSVTSSSGGVNAIPRGQIEYLYQRVLSETKKLGLPKREALSRRVVQDILERQPPTEQEMAALRGVGADKASRYFSIFESY